MPGGRSISGAGGGRSVTALRAVAGAVREDQVRQVRLAAPEHRVDVVQLPPSWNDRHHSAVAAPAPVASTRTRTHPGSAPAPLPPYRRTVGTASDTTTAHRGRDPRPARGRWIQVCRPSRCPSQNQTRCQVRSTVSCKPAQLTGGSSGCESRNRRILRRDALPARHYDHRPASPNHALRRRLCRRLGSPPVAWTGPSGAGSDLGGCRADGALLR